MQYKAELKPFKEKEGQKYKVIQFADLQFHSTPKRPTSSFGKKVRESFRRNTPGRVYSALPKPLPKQDDRSFITEDLQFDPDFMRMIQEEEAKGYKVLIAIPKGGVPVLPGEDTIEFLNSKNGKRLLRGLDRNKNWDKM